jgi:peptidyl-prolyl cis-trans isomerase SurA
MTLRLLRIPAVFVFGTMLLASSSLALPQNVAPQSPYGGTTVQDIIARINDRIITRSDYDRALKELDQESRQHGDSMQQTAEAHKDLLRNLIDQQLWLSKGKELGITGDTELIKRLDEIRKQYNLETLEDLEKAAKQQGVSYEDFKANIRNGIVTQLVMRQQVGNRIQFTPGEAERYYEQHKQDYQQTESVHLVEILISASPGDQAKLAAAKTKADDIETRLHAGGDFAQLARSFSDGTTASEGGELGTYHRGDLSSVLEEKTFPLKTGEFTAPILTRQGYIILKVVQHIPGGAKPYKEVMQDVEEAYYMSRMEPAIRDYLTKMREEAFIQLKPGFADTGASAKQTTPIFSAYTPPAPKKKKKVERTRFRESTHAFRQKSRETTAVAAVPAETAAAPVKGVDKKKHDKKTDVASEKPGKKEKIRFGMKPRGTLPAAAVAPVEDAGAVPETATGTPEPINPLEPAAPDHKTRFSSRARLPKPAKPTLQPDQQPTDALAPAAADAAEVADRQTQSGPLGLAGDTASKKKKKHSATTGDKSRLADKNKKPAASTPDSGATPATPEAPAAAPLPKQ